MKKLKVSSSDASYEKLRRIAERSGFIISQRKKHCRVETIRKDFITNIPRHSKIKKLTTEGIVKRFNVFGGNVEIS